MTRPQELPEWRYRAVLLVTDGYAVTLGLQVMVLAILFLAPRMAAPQPDDVSLCGYYWLRPEWELPAYVLGCALSLSLVIPLRWYLTWTLVHALRTSGFIKSLIGLLFILAIVAPLLLFVGITLWRFQWETQGAPLFSGVTAPFVLAMCPLLIAMQYADSSDSALNPRRLGLWDLAFSLFLIALLLVPSPSRLAGAILTAEGFNHWDHFVMFPALHYQHGARMATDFYVLYGVGWPMLFTWLDPVYHLDYGHLVAASVFIAIGYYVVLYAVLRMVTRSPFFALFGVLLALAMTVFSPILAGDAAIWQAPSTTPMRAPCDVLMLACLWRHMYTNRTRWLLGAGALAGVSVLFTTDTGILLCGVIALYAMARLITAEATRDIKRLAAALGGTVLCAGFVWFIGMAFASRSMLLTEPIVYLGQWLAGIKDTGASGVGAFRFFQKTDALEVFWFLLMTGVFLIAACGALLAVLHRYHEPQWLWAGLVGAYGLGRLTMFVWRTMPVNLLHGAAPFAILACLGAAYLWQATGGPARVAPRPWTRPARALVALGAWTLLLYMVLGSPTFHAYHGLFQSHSDTTGDAVCLYENDDSVCGIAPEFKDDIADIQKVVARIRALAAEGATPAVLDNDESMLCHGAGIPPWARAPRFFLNTFTRRDQQKLVERLIANPPPAVLIRTAPRFDYFADTWQALHDALPLLYTLEDTVSAFEVWRRMPRECGNFVRPSQIGNRYDY